MTFSGIFFGGVQITIHYLKYNMIIRNRSMFFLKGSAPIEAIHTLHLQLGTLRLGKCQAVQRSIYLRMHALPSTAIDTGIDDPCVRVHWPALV